MGEKNRRRCSRCKDTLPEGSNYCVSCGCQNEGAVQEKMYQSNSDAARRVADARRSRRFWHSIRAWMHWW